MSDETLLRLFPSNHHADEALVGRDDLEVLRKIPGPPGHPNPMVLVEYKWKPVDSQEDSAAS